MGILDTLLSAPTSLLVTSVAAGATILLLFSPLVPKIKTYFRRFRSLKQLQTAKFVKVGTVSSLNLYPVKSGKGIPLPSIYCGPFGVSASSSSSLLDRGWLIVFGGANRFVTMRQEPTLVLIEAAFDEASGDMTFSAADMSSVTFNTPGVTTTTTTPTSAGKLPIKQTKVFGVASSGLDCGDAVAEWIDKFLGKPGHRLIFKSPLATPKSRDINETIPWGGINSKPDLMYRHISYQDEAPVLVTNSASLDSLNTQLKSGIEMKRFRPNIVVGGGAQAWEEDRWEHVAFCPRGTDPNADPGCRRVVLRRVTPSCRCKVPTVDPETGVMDPEEEPLRTLRAFHPWSSMLPAEENADFRKNAVFGNCMGIVIDGVVEEGDEAWVLVADFQRA